MSNGKEQFAQGVGGMTLRDWFAGQALVALSSAELCNVTDREVTCLVADAYWIADVMLAHREERAAKS